MTDTFGTVCSSGYHMVCVTKAHLAKVNWLFIDSLRRTMMHSAILMSIFNPPSPNFNKCQMSPVWPLVSSLGDVRCCKRIQMHSAKGHSPECGTCAQLLPRFGVVAESEVSAGFRASGAGCGVRAACCSAPHAGMRTIRRPQAANMDQAQVTLIYIPPANKKTLVQKMRPVNSD